MKYLGRQDSASFFVFVLLLLVSTGLGQGKRAESPSFQFSPFRYVIIENRIEKDDSETSRIVEVLLEERAFSEQNLRILFELLSKRFPTEDSLHVRVHTSLDQAPTPEERDEGGTSGNPEPSRRKYYWAVYVRSDYDEHFRYSP